LLVIDLSINLYSCKERKATLAVENIINTINQLN
jgi:hypothetical protein